MEASNPDIQPDLSGTDLSHADLREFNFFRAHLEGTHLQNAHLGGANLREAHLEGADLQNAHLEGSSPPSFPKLNWEMCYYSRAPLEKEIHSNAPVMLAADLRHVFFDSATNLTDIILTRDNTSSGLDQFYFSAFLADVVWNDVNLAVVDWTQINKLGDELLIHIQDRNISLKEHRTAVRAYRQLATVLQSQGLNEVASHYAYRAKVLERRILIREIRLPSIMQAVIEGNENMSWNWNRVVQGDISVYLGEPARHRKQASFITILWQVFLMFILMIPLSIGSLAWGVVSFVWKQTLWKKSKENIIAFLKRVCLTLRESSNI